MRTYILIAITILASPITARADWPGFRAGERAGVAEGPAVSAFDERWRTPAPGGVSSPIVTAGRIVVTGVEGKELVTICPDASTGKPAWRKTLTPPKLEGVHPFSSPAAATPASDGERAYVYFGSFGLVAYDLKSGDEAWRRELPTPDSNGWGTASSPIIVGDLVVQICDSNPGDGYLLAVDRRTGKDAWRVARKGFKANWSTPIVWRHDGREELIVMGSARVVAYDPNSGAERWSAGGFSEYPIASPAVGAGLLFVGSAGPAGGGESRMAIPAWAEVVRHDKNKDGKLAASELPAGAGVHLRQELPKDVSGNFVPLTFVIEYADADKDKLATSAEWERMLGWVANNGPALAAIGPGATGDATLTNVAWKLTRAVPEMPSPLFFQGRLYLVRDGGIVACVDPATGKDVWRERLDDAGGQYAASPVAAGGNVYLCSAAGVVSVLKAGDKLEVVGRHDLGERVMSTPAIAGGVLYVRTEKGLRALGRK